MSGVHVSDERDMCAAVLRTERKPLRPAACSVGVTTGVLAAGDVTCVVCACARGCGAPELLAGGGGGGGGGGGAFALPLVVARCGRGGGGGGVASWQDGSVARAACADAALIGLGIRNGRMLQLSDVLVDACSEQADAKLLCLEDSRLLLFRSVTSSWSSLSAHDACVCLFCMTMVLQHHEQHDSTRT